MPRLTTCRGCGCDDDNACKGGCHWIARRICSRCSHLIKETPAPLVIVTYDDRPATIFVTRAPGQNRKPFRALPRTIAGSRTAASMLLADA